VELALRRAWPRRGRHLLLEYLDPDGRVWAGQWYGDKAQGHLERLARDTRAAAPHHPVEVVAERRLVVQGEGADRRLAALADLAAPSSARLVTHRAERRAVVQIDDGAAYAKVVAPHKAPSVAHSGRLAAGLGALRAPRLVSADSDRGISVWEALHGRSLHELGDDAPEEAWVAVGESLRLLHHTPPPPGLPVHGAGEELAVLATWFERLATFEPEEAAGRRHHLDKIGRMLSQGSTASVLIHRDLHDKQLLVDRSRNLGWIDFDTLSVGEAAIDLANLTVHLDLRVAQGRLSQPAAMRAAQAVITGYRPEAEVRRRVVAYAAATRLRLFCLYAFRPRTLAPAWLDRTDGATDVVTGSVPSAR
ncbi:MAG: phosphotransferase family protein, partial [Acidimicrobiia bacterium]